MLPKNVPPPSAELYHGKTATAHVSEKGEDIRFTKVHVTVKQQRGTSNVTNPGQIIKELFSFMKKADQTVLLVPLELSETKSCNYIDLPVHVPTADKRLLLQYFSHSVNDGSLSGVCMIRSEKSLWTIKQSPAVRIYLDKKKTYLSATQWSTEKRMESFFIVGISDAYTRRDDLKKAIQDHIGENLKDSFSIYPGRRNVYHEGKQTTFRAQIIDVLMEGKEETIDGLNQAFHLASEKNDIRLSGLNLIPIRPSMGANSLVISWAAKAQIFFAARSRTW